MISVLLRKGHSQQTECDSKLGVKKLFGLLGMEASSPVLSENMSAEWSHRDSLISVQTISSNQVLLFVGAGSIELSRRCLPRKLVLEKSLHFSPILHDPKGFEQVSQRKTSRSNTVHTATNFINLEEKYLKKYKGIN